MHSSSVRIRCREAEIRQLIGHGCCDAILHKSVDGIRCVKTLVNFRLKVRFRVRVRVRISVRL